MLTTRVVTLSFADVDNASLAAVHNVLRLMSAPFELGAVPERKHLAEIVLSLAIGLEKEILARQAGEGPGKIEIDVPALAAVAEDDIRFFGECLISCRKACTSVGDLDGAKIYHRILLNLTQEGLWRKIELAKLQAALEAGNE